MTPAINEIKKKKITYKIHDYEHNSSSQSYGLEAADKLNVAAEQVFKTLVVSLNNNELAVAILPVSSMLNLKLFAKVIGAKKAEMATPIAAERSTGYIMGGVSPLGQKKKIRTIIDASAKNLITMYISAGKRGLEIELCPIDLRKLTSGIFADISQ